MFNLTLNQKGWLQALLAILVFLGINQVMGRYAASILDVNPIIYSCVAFTSCSLILILNGGRGNLTTETLRNIDTWIYGIILMLGYIIGMILFSYISATQGTILQKISVLIGLLSNWLFFTKKPDKFQTFGSIVITSGIIIVAYNIENDNKGLILILSFLYGILQSLRIFIASYSRPLKFSQNKNITKIDPKADSRVIGVTMLAVATVFLIISLLLSFAQSLQSIHLPIIPTFNDFIYTPTIITGFISGIIIVAPSRMLEISSSKIIKSNNFTTITALSFISTVFWEHISAPITGLSIKEISDIDIFAGGLVTIGGVLIALTRKYKKVDNKKEFLKVETQNIENIDDSRNIIASSLEHFNHDIKKVASALSIPIDIVKYIMNDKSKTLAFKDKHLKNVARNYRINIAQADSLTGLLNRSGFLTELKTASLEANDLSLLYLDLNKFKPVNDTYGHATGDIVLQEIGTRLNNLFPTKSLITRLGGDEFCILLIDKTKNEAQKLIDLIVNEVSKPITVNNIDLSVGTSVGLANYPTDTNQPEELLDLADKQMYINKVDK